MSALRGSPLKKPISPTMVPGQAGISREDAAKNERAESARIGKRDNRTEAPGKQVGPLKM